MFSVGEGNGELGMNELKKKDWKSLLVQCDLTCLEMTKFVENHKKLGLLNELSSFENKIEWNANNANQRRQSWL